MGGRIKVRLQSAVLYLSPAVFLFFQTDFSRETVQINQVWVHFRDKQSKPVRFLLFSARMDPFGRVLIVSRSNSSIQLEYEWLYAKSHSF